MAKTSTAVRARNDGAAVRPTRRRFSVDEYYRMARAGILCPDERVELLEGEIIQMAAIGSEHARCVKTLIELFMAQLFGLATLSVQDPVHLADDSEPVPDVMLLRYRTDRYVELPRAEDVLLLIEVSHTTLHYDRRRKLPRYATAGISEVWIVDLEHKQLFVYRQPQGDGYAQTTTLRGGTLSPAAFPDITMSVAEILGRP